MQLKDITKTHRALIAFGGDGRGNQPVIECPAKLIAENPNLARERAIASEGMIYQVDGSWFYFLSDCGSDAISDDLEEWSTL